LDKKIHNGEYPELKIHFDNSDKDCVWLGLVNNPMHWEKEYLNITVEPIVI